MSFKLKISKAITLLKSKRKDMYLMEPKAKTGRKTARTAVALALIFVMGVTCLAGCGNTAKQQNTKPSTTQTQQVENKKSDDKKIDDSKVTNDNSKKTNDGKVTNDNSKTTNNKILNNNKKP